MYVFWKAIEKEGVICQGLLSSINSYYIYRHGMDDCCCADFLRDPVGDR